MVGGAQGENRGVVPPIPSRASPDRVPPVPRRRDGGGAPQPGGPLVQDHHRAAQTPMDPKRVGQGTGGEGQLHPNLGVWVDPGGGWVGGIPD